MRMKNTDKSFLQSLQVKTSQSGKLVQRDTKLMLIFGKHLLSEVYSLTLSYGYISEEYRSSSTTAAIRKPIAKLIGISLSSRFLPFNYYLI
jgi:hypothetical protein